MNPYEKYLNVDYDNISEQEMLNAVDELFNIDPTTKKGLFDEKNHYTIVHKIILSSLKLKYEIVKNKLRKIYPLTFPDFEKHYPELPPHTDKIEGRKAQILPRMPSTEEEKKIASDINALADKFRKK